MFYSHAWPGRLIVLGQKTIKDFPMQVPRNSPIEEVRGHWAPMGAEPMGQWMDGWDAGAVHRDQTARHLCVTLVDRRRRSIR